MWIPCFGGLAAAVPLTLVRVSALTLVLFVFQIDVNGDGQLEWSEFTEFCVEAGVATRAKLGPVDFSYVYDISYTDTTSHGPFIQSVVYDVDAKEVVVVEGGSSSVKFYSQGPRRLTCPPCRLFGVSCTLCLLCVRA
jgi:hypothetical protein